MSHISEGTAALEGSGEQRQDTEKRSVEAVAELYSRTVIQHQRQIRNATAVKDLYAGLYSSSHAGKIWQVAKAFLAQDVCQEWLRTSR